MAATSTTTSSAANLPDSNKSSNIELQSFNNNESKQWYHTSDAGEAGVGPSESHRLSMIDQSHSADEPSLTPSESVAERNESQLPPIDSGKDAYMFLAACFALDALVWGKGNKLRSGVRQC